MSDKGEIAKGDRRNAEFFDEAAGARGAKNKKKTGVTSHDWKANPAGGWRPRLLGDGEDPSPAVQVAGAAGDGVVFDVALIGRGLIVAAEGHGDGLALLGVGSDR